MNKTSFHSGEYKERHEGLGAALTQTSNGATAVIVIRLLCIKHTFVESKKDKAKGKRAG